MSMRELTRAGVLARVAAGTLALRSAAMVMAVSYRQAKRLYRRYRAEGARGLKHRSAGRRSNRGPAPRTERESWRWSERNTVARSTSGSGRRSRRSTWPVKTGLQVHHDTLRRWMLAAGLWSRARKRSPHRRRRERKRISASWCSSMAVFMPGLSSVGRRAAC